MKKDSNIKAKAPSIIDKESVMLLSIPLSEKAINIKIEGKDINNYGEVIEDSNFIIEHIDYLIAVFILTIIDICIVLKITKMLTYISVSKSKYDKYLDKILKQYDRLIVETTSLPKFNELNVFNVNSFSELLDVRDNILLPIMHYNVTKHTKSYFYIKNNNDLYLLTIKAVDMDGKNE